MCWEGPARFQQGQPGREGCQGTSGAGGRESWAGAGLGTSHLGMGWAAGERVGHNRWGLRLNRELPLKRTPPPPGEVTHSEGGEEAQRVRLVHRLHTGQAVCGLEGGK